MRTYPCVYELTKYSLIQIMPVNVLLN